MNSSIFPAITGSYLLRSSYSSERPIIDLAIKPSTVLILPFCVCGGISNSSSGILIVAYSDLTIDRFKLASSTHLYMYLTPYSASLPPNYTSVFLRPQ